MDAPNTSTALVVIAPDRAATPRGPGQPTKYTPERIARILGYLRLGNTRKAAGLASGISHETFSQWLNRYPEFSEAVENAEAEAELAHVGNVLQAAGKGAWQASAWWLERRRHDSWGRKDRIELIASVRELARSHDIDEDMAALQAEQILKELRSQARA